MPLLTFTISALLNVVVLGGLPMLGYAVYHRWRHKRGLAEIAGRAGLRLGEPRYLGYAALVAMVIAVAVIIWPPPMEASTRDGSGFRPFVGLGLSGVSVFMALVYGFVKTGFAEELLFRGLIAGALSRRLPLAWANLAQATIFLAPHLLLVLVLDMTPLLLIPIFAGALVAGWPRIKSGSILGPWLLHASGNVTTCLMVAIRTA